MATLSGIITPTNVETASSTSTLTNKTIDGDSNTVTNIPLSTGVTGTLPVANGGTGADTLTGVLKGNGTSAVTAGDVDLTSEVTGTLPVANGGTGAATLTANNVLLGNDTSAPLSVAPSTSGNVLTSNGTTWQSTAPAGGGAWEYISTTTASAAATVDITGIDSTYDQYAVLSDKFTTTSENHIKAQFFLSGSIVTTDTYYFVRTIHRSFTTISNSKGEEETEGDCMFAARGGSASESNSFIMHIFDPNTASVSRKIYTEHFGAANDAAFRTNTTIGNAGTGALTGIRLFNGGAGQTITGNFYLYGIKES